MEEKDSYIVIRCPKCGMEYLAAEIFYPSGLLGKPKDILRDDNGKILLVTGELPVLEEDWECERCNHQFKAKLKIKPDSSYDSRYDFNEDYTIDITDEDKEELF